MPLLPLLLKILPNLGVLLKLPRKVLVGISVTLVVVIGFNQIKTQSFKEGYEEARKEMSSNYQDSLEARITSLKEQYEGVVVLEQEKTRIAQKAFEKLREQPPKVKVHEVIKIIENDKCKSLSSDYIGLLNEHYGERPD